MQKRIIYFKKYCQIVNRVIKVRHALSITQEICLKCAELYIPNQRDRHDALIASTALIYDFTVVTRNLKDFANIDGLQILNPFTD